MAIWVVLTDFADNESQLRAGTVIDDAQFPDLAGMRASGLALLGYSASMDPSIAAFQAQQAQAGTTQPSLFQQLLSDAVVTVSGVPSTRNIIAGTGLTGGGTLAADRTLNVIGNADGSILANANDVQVGILATDAQHGARGGGTQHADVVAGGAAGFMTGADKTKLDGILANGNGAGVAKAFADSPYALGAAVSGVEVTTTGGVFVLQLPALAANQGRRVVVIDAADDFAANKCTLKRNAAEKINGAAADLDLVTDGTQIILWAGPTSWWTVGALA